MFKNVTRGIRVSRVPSSVGAGSIDSRDILGRERARIGSVVIEHDPGAVAAVIEYPFDVSDAESDASHGRRSSELVELVIFKVTGIRRVVRHRVE